MKRKILDLCVKKEVFLDKDMLNFLSKLEEKEIFEIFEIFSSLERKKRVFTKKLFNKHKHKFEKVFINVKIKKKNVKLLSNSDFSSKKIEVGDFIKCFRLRYEIIRGILEKNNINNLSSIRRIGISSGVYSIIAMVSNKRVTKNKNLLIEVEDLTGKIKVLINKENVKLFKKGKELLLDDVVVFRASGSNKMLFVNDIIYPEAELKKEKYGEFDEYIAFVGDFHVGSKMFLEKNLLKFVSWLNGEVGDSRNRVIAKKIKYLFVGGDNIDGVGVYFGQDKFLNIKTCKGQYGKVAEILGKIRGDVQIIMCPGQHDAVWIGEPQKIIPEKWASGLYKMENLHLVPNPALVEIGDGFKVLMYHGASINRFIDELPEIRLKFGHNSPTKVVKEILKRRHLAPTHSLMDYIPYDDDFLTIDNVPDIVFTADQHRAEVDCYNNILMVSASCWQSITPFEEKVGNIPDPCKIPLFNLKTREVKIIDFSDDEVKWEEGVELVCKLSPSEYGSIGLEVKK